MRILLIDHSNKLAPYKDQYRLFTDWPAALEAAKKLGWESLLPINRAAGMANMCRYGGVHLTIIGLDDDMDP